MELLILYPHHLSCLNTLPYGLISFQRFSKCLTQQNQWKITQCTVHILTECTMYIKYTHWNGNCFLSSHQNNSKWGNDLFFYLCIQLDTGGYVNWGKCYKVIHHAWKKGIVLYSYKPKSLWLITFIVYSIYKITRSTSTSLKLRVSSSISSSSSSSSSSSWSRKSPWKMYQ